MWATSSVVPRIMCDYPCIMGMDALSLYDQLTAQRTRFVRVDELCRVAAEKGALPQADELAAEARRPLKEKQGLEKAQGAFIAEILADPAAGTHLCHAMLLPHPRTAEKMAEYDRPVPTRFFFPIGGPGKRGPNPTARESSSCRAPDSSDRARPRC